MSKFSDLVAKTRREVEMSSDRDEAENGKKKGSEADLPDERRSECSEIDNDNAEGPHRRSHRKKKLTEKAANMLPKKQKQRRKRTPQAVEVGASVEDGPSQAALVEPEEHTPSDAHPSIPSGSTTRGTKAICEDVPSTNEQEEEAQSPREVDGQQGNPLPQALNVQALSMSDERGEHSESEDEGRRRGPTDNDYEETDGGAESDDSWNFKDNAVIKPLCCEDNEFGAELDEDLETPVKKPKREKSKKGNPKKSEPSAREKAEGKSPKSNHHRHHVRQSDDDAESAEQSTKNSKLKRPAPQDDDDADAECAERPSKNHKSNKENRVEQASKSTTNKSKPPNRASTSQKEPAEKGKGTSSSMTGDNHKSTRHVSSGKATHVHSGSNSEHVVGKAKDILEVHQEKQSHKGAPSNKYLMSFRKEVGSDDEEDRSKAKRKFRTKDESQRHALGRRPERHYSKHAVDNSLHRDEERQRKRQRLGMDRNGGDGGVARSKEGRKADQIGFYSGETRTILEQAKLLVRVYLATVDLFPDPATSRHVATTAFNEACRDVLGRRAKHESPNCTTDMLKLLKNEIWIYRGSLTRDSRSQITNLYGLLASEYVLRNATSTESRDRMKIKYTSHKVERLLDDYRYLKHVTEEISVDAACPFTHTAIQDLILFLFFPAKSTKSRKKSCTRLAVVEAEAFEPVTAATIALACTFLYHGLEEYKSGVFSEIDFAESEYTTFYTDIIRELKKLERSTRRPEAFEEIVDALTRAGRSRLGGHHKEVGTKRGHGIIPSSEADFEIEDQGEREPSRGEESDSVRANSRSRSRSSRGGTPTPSQYY